MPGRIVSIGGHLHDHGQYAEATNAVYNAHGAMGIMMAYIA